MTGVRRTDPPSESDDGAAYESPASHSQLVRALTVVGRGLTPERRLRLWGTGKDGQVGQRF